jgi:uncharacterized glyoxalase superfamily protein PhnB/predicted enzyme related to lactoylglutathione lyase
MPPTLADGKITYVEIPAADVDRSAAFYREVFGWRVRTRGDGATAFDDPTGEVSGAWVTGRPASTEAGLLLYLWCDDVAAAVHAVLAHGGELVQPIGADAPEITARFRDPAGNVIGLYQEPEQPAASDDVGPARIAPQLSVRRGRAAVDFYRAAFGAQEDHRVGGTDDDPSVVAQLSVGGATFWVADESPEHGNHSPESVGGATTRMLLVVDDPAAVVARAVAAGAREVQAVGEAHGWLLGRVEDPFGHHWEIGRPLVPWPPAA